MKKYKKCNRHKKYKLKKKKENINQKLKGAIFSVKL